MLSRLPSLDTSPRLKAELSAYRTAAQGARRLREAAFLSRGVTLCEAAGTVAAAVMDGILQDTVGEIEDFITQSAHKFIKEL